MKWFKHYTDNHRGRSTQGALDKFGHAGLAYYIILEMCAEKLQQQDVTLLTEDDCVFSFHRSVVQSATRLRWTTVTQLLNYWQTSNQLQFYCCDNEITIKMPMLLDLLESDQKRPRQRRAKVPTKSRLEENRLELEENRINNIDQSTQKQVLSESLLLKIYEKYPRKIGKSKGLKRLKVELQNEGDVTTCLEALDRFKDHLRSNTTDPKYIPHFSTWVNSWRDWIDKDVGAVSSDVKPKTESEKWYEKHMKEKGEKNVGT